MKDIDKWFAEKGEITFKDGQFTDDYYWCVDGSIQGSDWSIEKPDCREIVRERFLLSTICHGDEYICDSQIVKYSAVYGIGKDIREAEIKCLHDIYGG